MARFVWGYLVLVRSYFVAAIGVVIVSLVAAWVVSSDGSTTEPAKADSASKSAETGAARDSAKLLHKVYASTLEVMHERYFNHDKAPVPARALEDVFRDVARGSKIEARWIGVNAKVMGINHEPNDDFEKQAAAAIAAGKGFYEALEDGKFRRAEAIELHAGCLTCHGSFGIEPKTPRYAGLVIGVPLKKPE